MTEIFQSDTERPKLESLDDLISEADLIEFLGVNKRAIQSWRYGKDGKPMLPYVRVAKQIWYFKPQVVWWLNDWQNNVIDRYRVEHRKRLAAVNWKKR